MDRLSWWIISPLLITSALGQNVCPESDDCDTRRQIFDNVYKTKCYASRKIIAQVLEKAYVRVICRDGADWAKFDLETKQRVSDINKLVFHACELSDNIKFGSLGKQLLNDEIQVLEFESSLNWRANPTTETLQNMASLKELIMRNVDLNESPNDFFQNLPNLRLLNIQRTNLQRLPKNFFTPMGRLESIDLSANPLTTLEPSAFYNLNRLRSINIANNRLTKISERTFDDLASLESLNLNSNKLERLPRKIFSNLGNLKILHLSKNNFTFGSLDADLLSDCVKLRSFTLARNNAKMMTLPNGFFANLAKLTLIKLGGIGLHSLPEDLFSGVVDLRDLSIDGNYLSTLPRYIFNDTYELTDLNLGFNNLTSLPDGIFTNLQNLVRLDLSRNRFSLLPENFFSGLTSLRELNMEWNELTTLYDGAFFALTNIRVAILSHNFLNLECPDFPLAYILGSPLDYFIYLEELYLEFNNISTICSQWQFDSHALRVLNISNNRLESIKISNFQSLKCDIRIDLRNNNISHIYSKDIEDFLIKQSDTGRNANKSSNSHPQNVVIAIENNPLKCDCEMYDWLRYREKKFRANAKFLLEITTGTTRCDLTSDWPDVEIASLRSASFKCKPAEAKRKHA